MDFSPKRPTSVFQDSFDETFFCPTSQSSTFNQTAITTIAPPSPISPYATSTNITTAIITNTHTHQHQHQYHQHHYHQKSTHPPAIITNTHPPTSTSSTGKCFVMRPPAALIMRDQRSPGGTGFGETSDSEKQNTNIIISHISDIWMKVQRDVLILTRVAQTVVSWLAANEDQKNL